MRRSILAVSLILAASPALACTQEELQAKSIALAEQVKAITAKDPSKADAWRRKQVDVDRVGLSTTDLAAICAAYDQAIAEAEAEK